MVRRHNLLYEKKQGWIYLAIKALKKAIINRQPIEGMIFHSDRSSQYINNNYEILLKSLNIRHSYSKKGYPYNNVSIEIFNSI